MDMSSEQRLQAIESRLARIEKQLGVSSVISSADDDAKAVVQQVITPTTTSSPGFTFKYENWLGIVAVICFVLAAGFIVKLSIDSGWLTPPKQIAIAVLFGFALIAGGLLFLSLDRDYISLLPAAGIIILYLAVFAAHRLYALVSFEFAVIYAGVISLLCLSIFFKIKSDLYPIIAALGAYLAPLILDIAPESVFTLKYFVLCSCTFATVSIWTESRLLAMISAYLAILLTASVGRDLVGSNKLIASVLGLHFIIFSLATYFYSRHLKKPLTEREAWSFFPVLLVFYCAEYYSLSLIQPHYAAWLSLGFAAFLMCLYVAAKKILGVKSMASQSMLFTFVAIVLFHAGYIELLPSDASRWLMVLLIASAAMLPFGHLSGKTSLSAYLPFGILAFVVVGLEYLKMLFSLVFYDAGLGLWFMTTSTWPIVLLAIASIWLLYVRQKHVFIKDDGYGYAVLGLAHVLVVTACYRFADAYGSLAVSASWLVYAVAVMGFAYVIKDKLMARSALFILAFAAAKALLYDAASAPTVVRILCLLLTGTVLYGAGFVFKKIASWR